MSREVKLGVIGVGGMGGSHARKVAAGEVSRCKLVAVCDINPKAMAPFKPDVLRFEDSRKLIRSGTVDAVLIATPHYSHTTIGIDALEQGLNVLVEKPISVHKADAEKLVAAHRNKKQVFAGMFNQRTNPGFQKLKSLMDKRELGEISRVNWILTTWFRSDYYYAGGDWRATWAGEGGGVLLNQCPHQLDLLQWITGMPVRVRGFCALGKRHKIEVEDEVTAYFEYANGATGLFVTSTGEAPGVNRLEIIGDNGQLLFENEKLTYVRNEIPATRFLRTTKEKFSGPPTWEISIPIRGKEGGHRQIMINFAEAILDGVPLIAPAAEGLRSLELGNAMLYSSMIDKAVDLPMDGKAYERLLKGLIRESALKTKKSGRK